MGLWLMEVFVCRRLPMLTSLHKLLSKQADLLKTC